MQSRKRIRLEDYNYSQDGYYFITICTANRKKIFSDIVGQPLAAAEMFAPIETKLTQIGKIAEKQLLDLEKRYGGVKIDRYVIMPNHIHLVLAIKHTAAASGRPTVPYIIRAYKSLTTMECRGFYNGDIWQKSFYDHIIRDEKDYLRIAEYIESNPAKWSEDEYYTV